MNIVDYNTYSNQIYKAIVVNSNFQQDPQGEGRIQIYIPDMQYEYSDIYKIYMNSSDKASTGNMDKFPWAITLVANLKEGNIVYGNFIQNNYSQFIILGLDANNPANRSNNNSNMIGGTGSGYNINGDTLIEFTCTIIMQNEVGIDISQFPDDIPEKCYGDILPDDNGAWSIGLIQWNKTLGFDLLNYMKNYIPNWEDFWRDKSLYLYQDIRQGKAKNINYNTYIITEGSDEYNAVKAMLICEKGKEAQLNYAKISINEYIQDLQNNYGISNAAVIIWLSDLMNQYGKVIPETKQKAAELCNEGLDGIQIIKELMEWCPENYEQWYEYINRRNNTLAYIIELQSQGKLTSAGLIDEGVTTDISQGAYLSGNGQYSFPFEGSAQITCGYGQGPQGYSSGKKHRGVDFGISTGTPLYACTEGEIESHDLDGSTQYSGNDDKWYGHFCVIHADDGNVILYCHMSETAGLNGRITRGTYIGNSGYSGNVSPAGPGGAHLHFEVRTSDGYGNDIDPTPFLNIENVKHSTVNF